MVILGDRKNMRDEMTNLGARKYVYKFHPDDKTAAARVLQFSGTNKRLLEIGAGPGSITRPLVELKKHRVTALEYDPECVEILNGFCERATQGNLNDPNWAAEHFPGETFDIIVAADVLEHLQDPVSTLAAASTLLEKDGAVVISLPNISHNSVISAMLHGNFEYQKWGLLDETHTKFFSAQNVQDLIEAAGLKIVDAKFILVKPWKAELRHHWKALPVWMRLALGYNRYGKVYQYVIKVMHQDAAAPAIHLPSLRVPRTKRHT